MSVYLCRPVYNSNSHLSCQQLVNYYLCSMDSTDLCLYLHTNQYSVLFMKANLFIIHFSDKVTPTYSLCFFVPSKIPNGR